MMYVLNIMYMNILPTCLSVPGALRSSETGVTDNCKPLCMCWELNLGPLEELPVLLTAEPYLQLPPTFGLM